MKKEFIISAIVIGLVLGLSAKALGQAPTSKGKKAALRFFVAGSEVTKLEAIRAMIKDSGSEVMQCGAIALTPDAKVVRK